MSDHGEGGGCSKCQMSAGGAGGAGRPAEGSRIGGVSVNEDDVVAHNCPCRTLHQFFHFLLLNCFFFEKKQSDCREKGVDFTQLVNLLSKNPKISRLKKRAKLP